MKAFLQSAAHVTPSARQMAWFDTEFYAFLHFGVNTFTGREWGNGTESPAIFNPERLDCDQWAEAVKAAGARGMVITAKHHDGFCLWPSKYTEHSVKNSPWRSGKGDVVREVAEACRRAGLKFGFYLSPWDRNCALYGTPEYNDYYKAQLTELLTEYGDVFIVWFDGACGEGPNGKKQEYDFPGYIELVRKYQPNAVIFNDGGPDVRWIGNESGTARFAEWAVMPRELARRAEVQTGPAPLHGYIPLDGIYNTMPDLGALSNIMLSGGLCFCPAEVDMSIRPGWFYHPEEEPHSLERLQRTYITSVGGNACFHLNIPPTQDGLFDPRDVARLKELGDWLKESFSHPLEARMAQSGWEYTLTFAEKTAVRYVVLQEDIRQGQRVEAFSLEEQDEYGLWRAIYHGSTIGHKRICPVSTQTSALRVRIRSARDAVNMLSIQAY